MLYGYSSPDAVQEKKEAYQTAQALANTFREQNGSIVCRELLGLSKVQADDSPQPEPRIQTYYKKRPCALLAQDAAEILEAYIKEHPPKQR